ncbi:hypothetical protein MUP32_06885, partial [Candidatus Microgenomates bacterium]|nr:hypothetical protein [Candidatus Microgenomates bacterium]
QNDKLYLDDLRIYSAISDPYKDIPASADYAYWIIPYLFDSSKKPFGLLLGEGKFSLETKNDVSIINFTDKSRGSVRLLPEEITIDESLQRVFIQT